MKKISVSGGKMKKIFITLLSLALILIPINYISAAPIDSIEEIDSSKTYILYAGDRNMAIFDDGGRNEGWIRVGEFDDSSKFSFKISKIKNGYNLTNIGTNYSIKENLKNLNSLDYMVSDKNGTDTKMTIIFEDAGSNKYYLKDNNSGKYARYGDNKNYITFTNDKTGAIKLTIEETPKPKPYPYPENSYTLFDNPDGSNFYRIPAITTTNTGRLIAVADYRHDHGSDLGNHKIDLHLRYSDDNGNTWSDVIDLTKFNNDNSIGYGDPAIVADRESNKIMILCAYGTQGYWHSNNKYVSTRENPIRVARFESDDNGMTWSSPKDITSNIYNLDERFNRLFVASGRIVQSRYIKVGEYYRLYTAILEGKTEGNYVLYSDDFGNTWKRLGSVSSPVPGGDEAKIEELANGNVLISSRTGSGRFINVFKYDSNDKTYSNGTWENEKKKITLGNAQATNGEVYILYVHDNQSNKYTYLALQSLPTLKGRTGVGIYYNEVTPDTETVDDYIVNWSQDKFYMVQPKTSAYSTITLQNDGKIGFFYEDRYDVLGYDLQYLPLTLETITNNRYSLAFAGIGTKDNPFLVDSKEKLNAYKSIFKNEKTNFNIKFKNTSDAGVNTDNDTIDIGVNTDNDTVDIGVNTDNGSYSYILDKFVFSHNYIDRINQLSDHDEKTTLPNTLAVK